MIDERLDIELLTNAALARPDWHWVFVGPIVKIDPADLPRSENVHYLGSKSYKDLPSYLSGLGCRDASIRTKRVHSIYQSNENPGIPGGR
ncbi:MAG: hypothetical protein WKF84_08130 [Pyrinomonadaceae bacterium]